MAMAKARMKGTGKASGEGSGGQPWSVIGSCGMVTVIQVHLPRYWDRSDLLGKNMLIRSSRKVRTVNLHGHMIIITKIRLSMTRLE